MRAMERRNRSFDRLAIRACDTSIVAEHRLSPQRPTLVIVPPGVFHGVKALGSQPAMLINMVDQAYAYEDPDHWRLPEDAREIPYRFSS